MDRRQEAGQKTDRLAGLRAATAPVSMELTFQRPKGGARQRGKQPLGSLPSNTVHNYSLLTNGGKRKLL